MPIYGENNTTAAGTNTGTGHNILHKPNDPAQGGTGNVTGHHGHTGPGPALGAVTGGAAGHYEGHTAVGTALGAAVGHHHAKTHPDVNHHPAAATGATGQAYAGHGAGMGAGTGAGAGAGMGSGVGSGGGGASELIGKLEQAAGTVLGSNSLKAKGIQKEREAQALKGQSQGGVRRM